MKNNYILLFSLFSIVYACKTENKTKIETLTKELSILEKVAHAHGFINWKNISEVKFSFNVNRDTTHFERTWIWEPKSNNVTSLNATDTLSYNRKNMDSISRKTNAGFINDKYWLLAPFNLIWDKKNITYEHSSNSIAPISGKKMQKLTIVYHDEGGYTPGDAYDFYFEEDYIIQEWVFRKSNQPEPTMTTTWEKYTTIKGLLIATSHKNQEGDFELYFTNVKVKTR